MRHFEIKSTGVRFAADRIHVADVECPGSSFRPREWASPWPHGGSRRLSSHSRGQFQCDGCGRMFDTETVRVVQA